MAISSDTKLISLDNLKIYNTKISALIDAVDGKVWVGTVEEYNEAEADIEPNTLVLITDDTDAAEAEITLEDIKEVLAASV